MASAGVDDDKPLVQGYPDSAEEWQDDPVEESEDDPDAGLKDIVDWRSDAWDNFDWKSTPMSPGYDSDADSAEYVHEKYRDIYKEYRTRIEESEGYDLDKDYDWPERIGGFVPIFIDDTNTGSLVLGRLRGSVEFAIRDYNKNKNPEDHLKLGKLLRATLTSVNTYYATFLASSEREGDKIYQSQVWVNVHDEENSRVLEFRKKPDDQMRYLNDLEKLLPDKACGKNPSGVDQTGHEKVGGDVEVGGEAE